ncbi:MAG: cytochrome c biogenesis protein CcsA [Opitutales bacterium]|nr:cytochrome c biogenesis protein CcsA [Opitutales bacterium]
MNEIFENRIWFACAGAIFGASCVLGLIAAKRTRGNATVRGIRFSELLLSVAGWLFLTFALGQRVSATGHLPFSNIFEIFQSLGWCALFSTVLLRAVWGLCVPVFAATGTAAVLCVLSFVNVKTWDLPSAFSESSIAGTPWIELHVGFATVGYACFSAAAMIWWLFLLQNSALRRRYTHRFFAKLPDLAALERIGRRLCSAGLVFFGFGIGGGVVALSGNSHLGSRLAVYKILVSALIFCGFALVLFLRRKNKISALKFSRAGLAIFISAIVLLGGIACLREAPPPSPGNDVPAQTEEAQ